MQLAPQKPLIKPTICNHRGGVHLLPPPARPAKDAAQLWDGLFLQTQDVATREDGIVLQQETEDIQSWANSWRVWPSGSLRCDTLQAPSHVHPSKPDLRGFALADVALASVHAAGLRQAPGRERLARARRSEEHGVGQRQRQRVGAVPGFGGGGSSTKTI